MFNFAKSKWRVQCNVKITFSNIRQSTKKIKFQVSLGFKNHPRGSYFYPTDSSVYPRVEKVVCSDIPVSNVKARASWLVVMQWYIWLDLYFYQIDFWSLPQPRNSMYLVDTECFQYVSGERRYRIFYF